MCPEMGNRVKRCEKCPVLAIISVAIFIEDLEPVILERKRVGKDSKFFYRHKFWTIKMLTPHDVPTHQLKAPDQYSTKVGRMLRRTSLYGRVIIGQTIGNLESKGFCEVSPCFFHRVRPHFLCRATSE